MLTDFKGAHVLRARHKDAVAVPEEIAVVGSDDERITLLLTPTLITNHPPLQELRSSG